METETETSGIIIAPAVNVEELSCPEPVSVKLEYNKAVPVRRIASDAVEQWGLKAGALDALPKAKTRTFYWAASASSALSVLERGGAGSTWTAPSARPTVSGSKNSYIATLVERQTRYVMLVKVANKETLTVVSALIRQARKLPTELYKSLTWDRGKELADHRRFSLATDIDVYFWGSNENTNGLLRQYFPKGTDVSVYSQAHLNKVARQLNERPRKTLGFETPAERFNACVASTG